ncbi:protein FAR1-RELATED SEQUENCE 5-like [Canna indica]|uniref:Protein FAR1-RELATED SEQUENCE 5-like n=1 Tax=Canna indica TaxID=4628 RepID=A0AAQ3KTB6_9LILI|nr:protein FAR1-RELATED SEQUENCE 5-like [Canna indica]
MFPTIIAENSQHEPKPGMTFTSEMDAYDFYNSYAKKHGFSVRKSQVERRSDGTMRSKKFVCSKQGTREIHRTHVTKKPKPIERTNCKALIEFKINTNNVWTVSKVELNHNHQLASPNKVHMLRSHRKLLPYQKELIDHMDKAGFRPHQIFNFFEAAASKPELVGFIRKDANNYISQQSMMKLKAGDIQTLLYYLKSKQVEDPSFFYALQVHETGEITNFFWADGRAIIDYSYFGDVVSFDTTFQTNKYEMPFAPLLGMNNHKQTVLFGAALLFDETVNSFVWLFQTFMAVMGGKQPSTIFTEKEKKKKHKK